MKGRQKKTSDVQHPVVAKRGKSAGAIVAQSTKICNGGTAYKPKGMGRSGGSLVGKETPGHQGFHTHGKAKRGTGY